MTRIFCLAGFFGLILATAPAWAAPLSKTPVDPFHRWTDADLKALASKTPNAAADMDDHEFFWFETLLRPVNGVVERHEHWNDYFVIQEGHATLTYGGHTVGAKEVSPGDWRGGTIQGGKQVPLNPGDTVVIPAGYPHLVTLIDNKPIRYLVFKARQ